MAGNKEVVRVLALPEVRERLSSEGAELAGSTPQQFDRYVESEIEKWARW